MSSLNLADLSTVMDKLKLKPYCLKTWRKTHNELINHKARVENKSLKSYCFNIFLRLKNTNLKFAIFSVS